MNAPDLTQLPPPEVVETLDFETILQVHRADLLARYPEAAAVIDLESEPLNKLLQAHAYRELLYRQRVNEAARAHLLAFATGADLDHKAAFYGLTRLAGESDERLRARVQLRIKSLAGNGTREAYELTAMTASQNVRDARATQPFPGRVHLLLWCHDAAQAEATLATVLAVPAGIAITRYDFPGRGFLNGLFLSPLIIPHLVLGVALLRLFALLGGTGSFGWLVFAHALIVTPYTLRLVVAALVGFDRSAEHAALSLGASQATVFTRITLPMILPGVTGGWMLAFINSFDEVTMSIFVTSPSTVTLPVRMYMYATESIDPLMAAVSALMVGLTACAMVVLDRVYGLDRVLVGRK